VKGLELLIKVYFLIKWMFGILCVCFDIEENMFYLYEKSLDGIVCWVYVIGRNMLENVLRKL
jgi:hypothetical protein